MQLTEYWVVALVLIIATTCRPEIVIANEIGSTFIVQDLVKIVTSCYGHHIDAVGLAGDLPDNLARTLNQHSIPVALIEDTSTVSDKLQAVPDQFSHKLRVFIVGASSDQHLYSIIAGNIHSLPWNNHMASFFILTNSFDCRIADYFLFIAWNNNIINAKVMCRLENQTYIVSFNPFTNQAPDPWHLLAVRTIRNWKNPFSLFGINFRKNEAICPYLDFDKTKDLDGYMIYVQGHKLGTGHSYLNQSTAPFSYNFIHSNERTLHNLFGVLHATPKFFMTLPENDYHTFDMARVPIGLNGLQTSQIRTYPHLLNGYVIITRFRGHKSQMNKILGVIDSHSRLGVGVVYLITLIFFKFFVHQALVPAILNLVRITCNMGFTNLPDSTAPKMYLTGLLFFVVTIQGIYQGNLASLLTTIIPLRDVHTMQDLIDFGYEKIYGYGIITSINEYSYIREHYIDVDLPDDCILPVENDPLAACIVTAGGTPLDLAAEAKLHVGNRWVETMYTGFSIREAWPLVERVNQILSRMVESGGLEPWDVKCNAAKFTDFQFDEEVMANVEFKNIELREVLFAFVILGIGLGLAIITFIVELTVHRFKSRVVNVRLQILK